MTNELMKKTLLDWYDANSYSHRYIMGFIDHGMVYVSTIDHSDLPFVVKLDIASRGKGYCIRFKPTRSQKELLKVTGNCFVLCSEKAFMAECAESKYNKGEVFEKLITEKNGQVWNKDSVAFTDDGDITIDSIPYQIKFENASFCSERQMLLSER